MALGGGKWTSQNKILPGTYINHISMERSSVDLAERGIVAIPVELDWGQDGVFTVEVNDFLTNSFNIFGYDYTHDKLIAIREVFKHAKKVHFYKLNRGEKAKNELATARCSGVRGNDLTISVIKDIDDTDTFIVKTHLDNVLVDEQEITSVKDLVDNDFVEFNEFELKSTAGIQLEGGTNGEVTGKSYQDFLDEVDNFNFNVLGCTTSETKTIQLFVEYTKRMRDDVGKLFQTVIFDSEGTSNYDYEGVVSVVNEVTSEEVKDYYSVYWVAGALAGCEINKSLTNTRYDGELLIDTNFNQTELAQLKKKGKFVLHRQNDEVRVLSDINSLVTFTKPKSQSFALNQVIRIIDTRAIMIANLFNDRYLGEVPNNESGRESLWGDIVAINQELERLEVLENYNPDDLIVTKGNEKHTVYMEDTIDVTVAMEILYVNTFVK